VTGGLDATAFALLLAGAALAGLVQGIAGFAFGMVSTSVWIWGLEPRLAAAMAVFGSLVGQLLGLATIRRGWHWPALWPFLAGGALGLPVGVWLLPQLDAVSFRLFLGGMLVVVCPLMLAQTRLPALPLQGAAARLADATAGTIGGLMGGLGGYSGVVPTLWCTLRRFDRDRQRAVIQNFLLAAHSATVAGYAANGVLDGTALAVAPAVAAATLLPGWLGAHIYKGLSEAAFRWVVLVLLFATGATLLVTTLPKVLS
jgi:uncharacterized membrane protein YfcA